MELEYEIIDNFLSREDAGVIYDTMLGLSNFPWYLNNSVVYKSSIADRDFTENYQFTHLFYQHWQPSSPWFDLLKPITHKLNPPGWQRIKANLNPKTENKIVYDWHTDYNADITNAKTAIYYINNNDGITLLRKDTKTLLDPKSASYNNEEAIEIESVANRLVIFNQNIAHTGTTCTDKKVRCLINFNFIDENRTTKRNE